jgi:uncharacterized protein
MMKVLLTLAIVVLALMWWFGKGRGGGGTPQRRYKTPAEPAAQAMVSCAHCGLHLPQPDAVEGEGGRHYCSREHLRLGPGPRA